MACTTWNIRCLATHSSSLSLTRFNIFIGNILGALLMICASVIYLRWLTIL